MTYKKEKKEDLTLLQPAFLRATSRVLGHGEVKHGRDNYLTNPAVEDRELVAAIGRHWLETLSNPEAVDPDHGETHVAAIAANCNMLLARFAARRIGDVTNVVGRWHRVKQPSDAPVGSKVRNIRALYGHEQWPEGTEFVVVSQTLYSLGVREPCGKTDMWNAEVFEVYR